MIIAIDFDGTIVDHLFPMVGPAVPGAIESIKELKKQGHTLILYTMRGNLNLGRYNLLADLEVYNPFQEAKQWCIDNDLGFDYYNENHSQLKWTNSPKIYAQIYIDDLAVGCPLKDNPRYGGLPYVDWEKVMQLLKDNYYKYKHY